MEISLVKADMSLFAIYQTMYSNADIEMWYDWDERLNDTKWTDQCYFLMIKDKKIGGVIVTDDALCFPFLISPFCDRMKYWNSLIKQSPRLKINCVLEEDKSILPMFNYKAIVSRQVMCRPADSIETTLSSDFTCRNFDINKEKNEIGNIILKGYSGGIDYEIYGEKTLESIIDDIGKIMNIYAPKNLSHVIIEKATDQIAGICLAGTGKNHKPDYIEIAEICVLPQFRGRDLAKYMISRIVTQAHGLVPFVKLCVTVGNNAEYLYRQMGFISGPSFTDMIKRN
jgi:ribosomal protein S18 acetylase RimI-like enzyme